MESDTKIWPMAVMKVDLNLLYNLNILNPTELCHQLWADEPKHSQQVWALDESVRPSTRQFLQEEYRDSGDEMLLWIQLITGSFNIFVLHRIWDDKRFDKYVSTCFNWLKTTNQNNSGRKEWNCHGFGVIVGFKVLNASPRWIVPFPDTGRSEVQTKHPRPGGQQIFGTRKIIMISAVYNLSLVHLLNMITIYLCFSKRCHKLCGFHVTATEMLAWCFPLPGMSWDDRKSRPKTSYGCSARWDLLVIMTTRQKAMEISCGAGQDWFRLRNGALFTIIRDRSREELEKDGSSQLTTKAPLQVSELTRHHWKSPGYTSCECSLARRLWKAQKAKHWFGEDLP